jgi:chemotaxis response regulator CheB
MSYGELRKMSEQVRNTQMQLSTHCEALESGLLEKIQTLEANQRRQELTIAAKNRECEELRADNEKLQLYVRLTTSQSQASSAVAYGASQGGMGALRS